MEDEVRPDVAKEPHKLREAFDRGHEEIEVLCTLDANACSFWTCVLEGI